MMLIQYFKVLKVKDDVEEEKGEKLSVARGCKKT